MALQRACSPVLVVCSSCRDSDALSDRLVALADPETGALSVRDVCAAAECAELQVRSHLCADHVLEFELAWLHQIPVRACHGCRQSVILLYREKRDVWFVLPRDNDNRTHRGVEVRVLDPARVNKNSALGEAAFHSPVRAAKGKARAKLSSGKKRMRRSARTLQQLCDRERLRALEWSLGNIEAKYLFLWNDNKRRIEAEKMHGAEAESTLKAVTKTEPHAHAADPFVLPEPDTVFCVVAKCRFYAKSGERCRFHSTTPLAASHAHARAMTAVNGETAAAPSGEEDVKRRVRFDAEADLRLLQAVVKREPFAADHGTKLKAWDDVADEVYATATKLRDVPSSRRAVTDRFHHLLLRYEQGTLKLKRWTDTPNGEEKAALVVNLFRLITARMADIRTKKTKRTPTSGGRSSISSLADLAAESRKRSGGSSADADDLDDDDSDDDEPQDVVVTSEETTGANGATDATKPKALKRPHADTAAFHAEVLALKRAKLELKREKLALLRDQHEQRMELERQRVEFMAEQLNEARLTRLGAAPSSAPSAV